MRGILDAGVDVHLDSFAIDDTALREARQDVDTTLLWSLKLVSGGTAGARRAGPDVRRVVRTEPV